ncbi:hypothetical protein LZG04_12160 [Saccharothrix sp. S26]|nr:hypothetical protein [Saccharothrix sp. S26]MCE6995549.1 hypothetical protein [Saccharothrix sp. S26]
MGRALGSLSETTEQVVTTQRLAVALRRGEQALRAHTESDDRTGRGGD